MRKQSNFGNELLDIVKYLHNNRSEGFTKWAMDLAAYNGDLAINYYLNNI